MDILRKYLEIARLAPEGAEGGASEGTSASAEGTGNASSGAAAPQGGAGAEGTGAAASSGGSEGQEQVAETPRIPKDRFDQVVRQRWDAHNRAETAEGRAKVLETSLSELQRRIASLPAETQQALGLTPGASAAQSAAPPAGYLTPQQAEEYAAAKAETQRFNEQCNAVAREGQKKFKDFDDRLADLRKMSPFDPAVGSQVIPQTLVQAALELDEPAAVLHALGSDPIEAERIISLPPVRQAAALAKFASKAVKAPSAQTISRAPPPLAATVSGGASSATVDLYDSKTSVADWMAERNKQVEARGRR